MTERPRILVVDEPGVVDDLAVASDDRATSVAFERATSASAAVDALEAENPPVGVVTEYDVSDDAFADGVALVDDIRDRSTVPVVVYTDGGSESVASRATVAGASAYVSKDGADAAANVVDVLADELGGVDRTREKIETLHDVATDLAACETEAAVYERTIDAAEQVLEFDQCLLDVIRDDRLVPVAKSSGLPEGGAQEVAIDAENVAARVARTRKATINNDLSEVTDADPAEMTYRSGFTVPVSDVGVFQAVAEETAAFDADDLELAQLLAAHVAESLKRVRNRQDLREERDRFAALFENVPDPAVRASFGDDGTLAVDSVNAAFARTFDCDQDAVRGRALSTVVEAPNGSDVGAFLDVEADGEAVAREVQRTAADGVRDFILHVIPIDGRADEVYGIYTDITENKERQRALQRQNDRLDEFAGIVSHDLRNPLNVAEGHLVNYRETGDEASLDEVSAAHERMRSLVDDLLDLARSGDVVSETSSVVPGEAARRAWASLPTPDAELVVEETTPVLADVGRLVDVFANLFRNALDHVGDAVTVRVGDLPSRDGFYVADDGHGIPESEREAVFETGYTNATDGSGFGLAIVEQVASAHGWTVSIVDGESGGARFEFRGVDRPGTE
ncbi:GAF domain-containing protein [Halorubellus sp. JP-L1]|uniref:hybrid sensor histidine kinase/response regulator n=1 Tax=Halorubellus sp. JP-L1 TaxID=2715753 RepID=UPI0014086193|nr:ATP-binding protein [Halorubellus sp. JP-L1]NHN40567.1 GAF domain-containing protein [Halorubellus sp. JP-L1]